MASFELVRESERLPDVLLRESIADLTSRMAASNYVLQNVVESSGGNIITFARTYRPWYQWLFGIILIPLLFLNFTATVTVLLEPTDEGGTRVRVAGDKQDMAQRAFAEWEF